MLFFGTLTTCKLNLYFNLFKLLKHIFLQVCNAVYIRLNWTQPLCACPPRYRDPCSASLNSDDFHTTKLITGTTSEVRVSDIRKLKINRHTSTLILKLIYSIMLMTSFDRCHQYCVK